jgi:hypothetical protein
VSYGRDMICLAFDMRRAFSRAAISHAVATVG